MNESAGTGAAIPEVGRLPAEGSGVVSHMTAPDHLTEPELD